MWEKLCEINAKFKNIKKREKEEKKKMVGLTV